MTVDDSAIIGIIRFYTREAGVRSLEREISKLCRKAVKTLLMDKKRKHIEINGDNLKDYRACSALITAVRIPKTAWAKSPGWRGRKWAAIC